MFPMFPCEVSSCFANVRAAVDFPGYSLVRSEEFEFPERPFVSSSRTALYIYWLGGTLSPIIISVVSGINVMLSMRLRLLLLDEQ